MTQANVILLVEDSVTDAELALHVLRKQRLADVARVSRDGAEALEFLFGIVAGGHPNPLPKLVLLDLKLPRVNGLEVLARIKADPRTKTIPVVVLTSSREDQDLIASYELGANSYVVKPVDFAEFEEALRQVAQYWLTRNEQLPHCEEEGPGADLAESFGVGCKGHGA